MDDDAARTVTGLVLLATAIVPPLVFRWRGVVLSVVLLGGLRSRGG